MTSKRDPGLIVKIDMKDGYHIYACNLQHNALAVYDAYSKDDLSIPEIISRPILFTPKVAPYGHKKWNKVGIAPFKDEELHSPPFFHQPLFDSSEIFIVDTFGKWHPANFEDIQDLENISGWMVYQLERRIRDYYSGKTNWQQEYMRPKPPTMPSFFPGNSKHIPEAGAIKQIDLGDETYVFGQELPNTFIRVYDSRTTNAHPPENLMKLPILFTVSISLSARLGWPKVTFEELQPDEPPLPDRYIYEGIAGDELKIYDANLVARSATAEEIVGLEPAVMWDNYHIVNRLRAHYAGNPWKF